MILKVQTKAGWRFIDRMERVRLSGAQVWRALGEKETVADFILHQGYDVDESVQAFKDGSPSKDSDGNQIFRWVEFWRDGTRAIVVFDGRAFLLSDAGETIERV